MKNQGKPPQNHDSRCETKSATPPPALNVKALLPICANYTTSPFPPSIGAVKSNRFSLRDWPVICRRSTTSSRDRIGATDASALRIATKALVIRMLTSAAISLFRTLASMRIPCSVNAYGRYLMLCPVRPSLYEVLGSLGRRRARLRRSLPHAGKARQAPHAVGTTAESALSDMHYGIIATEEAYKWHNKRFWQPPWRR